MYAESSRRALRLGRFQFVRGFRLTTFTFAGSSSKVDLILEKLNAEYIDRTLSTPIRDFHPENQRLVVIATVKAISDHVYPHCPSDTLLKASLDDEDLIFVKFNRETLIIQERDAVKLCCIFSVNGLKQHKET